jgi:hypothetical protein
MEGIMPAENLSGQDSENLSPTEREARWDLRVQLAIQASGEEEARTILSDAWMALRENLRLRGAPLIRPRYPQTPDDIWIAELEPDLTHLLKIEPDNAQTRCSYVMGHFPISVEWVAPENTERRAEREWPPDVWHRTPGTDDQLLHPAVRAVRIFCKDKQVSKKERKGNGS